MLHRLAVAFLWVPLLVVPFLGQSSSRVVIDRDVRLFTMMAALNVAGFDVELASQYHPVREVARGLAQNLDPGLVQRLKSFYASHKENQPDDAQLAKYISLAVHLSGPPDFVPSIREELMPPDARSVADFVPLLKEFYQQARVSDKWLELRAEYEREINQLGPALRDMIVATDAYLRLPLGGSAFQTMAIYIELAAPVNSVNFRSYQDDYYVVMGNSTAPKTDAVRHAYLHFQLERLVGTHLAKMESGGSLLALPAGADGIQREYVSNLYMMTTESLIRAVEVRLDKPAPDTARQTIDGYYRSGLMLAPYFFDALGVYEQREEGIREYFPAMASAVKVADERVRFNERFSKIPVPERVVSSLEVPEPQPLPPPNPTRDLLKAGEAAFNAGDNTASKAAFEKVLSDFDRTNGSAFYGLALIASKEGDSEGAQQYFERTVRSESAEPAMKVWAYIFLARISDLKCERNEALEYYQQAMRVGDNTRNAQTQAAEGLKTPFGDGCR